MRYSVLPKTFLAVLIFRVVAEAQAPTLSQQYQGVVDQYAQQLQQSGGGRGAAPGGTPSGTFRYYGPSPAWWTNTNLLTQLGLRDDQKAKIQGIYENHKQNIASDSEALDKQEAQLRTLLAADPVDHNAVLAQIDRVAQARADLERSNSAMTLEMREVLTGAQWAKLQTTPTFGTFRWLGDVISTPFGPIANPRTPPDSGQRSGQRQQ